VVSDLVTLRDGTTIVVDALRLSWAIEEQGCAMTAQDGKLHVANGSRLTPAQCAAIKQHKAALLHIAGLEHP
jgi:hypothetical protein